VRKITGGLALVAVLALAGCSKSASATEYRPADPFTVSDALGATGGLLIIPFIALVIIGGIRHFIAADNMEPIPRWAFICYMAGGACMVLAILLWIVAIWGAVQGT
jgi:hypothetical protein